MEEKEMSFQEDYFLYVGNWNHIVGTTGLYAYSFCAETGEAVLKETVDDKLACGSFCLSKSEDILYVANEIEGLPDPIGGGGRIMTYKIDRANGSLIFLSETPTLCANPSYISLDEPDHYMVVSNHASMMAVTKVKKDADGNFYPEILYDDSIIDLFSLSEDGCPGKLLDVVKHEGAGGESRRQRIPHPHCAVRSPSGRLYAVCDKGNNRIYFYTIDKEKNQLKQCSQAPFQDEAGSSPRYGAFHPEKPFFFCNHEGIPYVHTFRYTEEGTITLLSSTNIFENAAEYDPAAEQQDFKMLSSGKIIYDLVHGRNSNYVAVLRVNEQSGETEVLQLLPTEGEWPRGCALSPDEKFLAVGCMADGIIQICEIQKDGRLKTVSAVQAKPGLSSLVFVKKRTI